MSDIHNEYADLCAENEEQARLLGMSGSREAKLLAENKRLRELLREAIETAKAGYRAGVVSIEKWQSALDGGKA